jgi:4-hydroxy-2-oxoheptanedioate aldolase
MPFDPTVLPPNSLKVALKEGRRQLGFWTSLCSNVAAEILAGSGFDWILIDTEHAPNDVFGIIGQLQAMMGGSAEPVVRVAWNDTVLIKRILDIGARSLLVPFVQNADEARHAVAATRYPPHGVRGAAATTRSNRFGRIANYHRKAHEDICILVQVETRSALKEIEAIAAVDGVDGVFIGPSDLAADLGHLADVKNAEVQAAIADACARIHKAGKPAGILTGDPDDAIRYFKAGFTFVATGNDAGVLAQATSKIAAHCKQHM